MSISERLFGKQEGRLASCCVLPRIVAVFLVSLFVSHIRPIMEYCSRIWNVVYLADVRLFESVQRRWTRETFGIGHFSYVERLKKLGLHSVYGRCVQADLIKCWKLFHSKEYIGLLNFLSLFVDRRTRGYSLKFVLSRCNRELKRFFHVRVIQRWNALPEHVIMQSSLVSFKRNPEVELGNVL